MQIVPWSEVRVCPMCLSSIKYGLADLTTFYRMNDSPVVTAHGLIKTYQFVLPCTCGYQISIFYKSLPEEIYQMALNQCGILDSDQEYDSKADKFVNA